jgi:CRP-like cAMP-binding protein
MGKRHHDSIERLRAVPLFSACSERELDRIDALATEVDLPAGKVLIAEGSADCREAFVILEGTAAVSVRGVQVALVGPGACVGEMGVIERAPRTATVVALTDLRTLVLDPRGLAGILANGSVSWKLLSQVDGRLRALEAPDPATDRVEPAPTA